MKREPSIHITLGEFKALCKKFEVKVPVEDFFRVARSKQITSRAFLVTNHKINKQVENKLLASKGDTSLAADILYAVRIKLKHKGVRKYTEASGRSWTQCKQLASVCNTFCHDFNLEPREGFITYMEVGLKLMKDHKNLLARLISLSELITQTYESMQEYLGLSKADRDKAEYLHDVYVSTLADSTGILEDHKDNLKVMTEFHKAYQFMANEAHTKDCHLYIKAQFDALLWCQGIPQIQDLYGEKALTRYNKYLYKHRIDTPHKKAEQSILGQMNQILD